MTYQEMVYCTDLNLPINVKTVGSLFEVIPAQTKPRLVCYVPEGWRVLHCALKNEIS